MDQYMVYIGMITIAGAILLAIMLSLAIPPKHTKKVLSWLASLSFIAALGMYGYGYCHHYLDPGSDTTFWSQVLQTVWDTSRIFVGSMNWDDIRAAYDAHPAWEILFRVIHLIAMSVSACAIIVSLGSNLLRRIRLRLTRWQDISLIFGLNENTLAFGRKLAEEEKSAIVYIDTASQSTLSATASRDGILLRSDDDALAGSERFVRSLGLKPGKRKLRLYALDSSLLRNQQYAYRLLDSLKARGILPEQTSLTIIGVNEDTDHPLQSSGDRYGYGSIISINEPEMVARLLIRSYPPHKSITFDETGKAVSDFHAVLVGFGQVGQSVLRQLVMNSQFHGSKSRITVFAPDYESRMGWLSQHCLEMLNQYDITLLPYDGRSRQFYDYIAAHIDTINYVAICAGNETINMEINERLHPFLAQRGCKASILMCSKQGVFHQTSAYCITAHQIYTPELLCSDRIDRMAMVLNQSYHNEGDMRQNWEACSYFDRMSSRAAADFYDAVMHMAGVTKDDVLRAWDPRGILMENMAITEHLRWNAFHYCMGFRTMTEDEFQARAAVFRAEKAKDPNTKYRVTKDMDNLLHACLIPWDALDDYSRKENAVTGGHRDYKENDRQNIRDLAKILRAMESEDK